jgi:hypothetical protein
MAGNLGKQIVESVAAGPGDSSWPGAGTSQAQKEATRPAAGEAEMPVQKLTVNLADARNAMRARFIAVGLFMSVLMINWRQVTDTMKKIWKVRGDVNITPLPGRRFILEFSVEGDMRHAIRGGPWRYRGDAFLVTKLEVGVEPSLMQFITVPIWVQFHKIPFYLLSKELAAKLGEKVGEVLLVDVNSHGNINEKFMRARVLLPLHTALQKSISLIDEETDEEVVTEIRYERLPNFCLYCGLIGHKELQCFAPEAERRTRYTTELCVPPVIQGDPRSWLMSEGAVRGPYRARQYKQNNEVRALQQTAVEEVANGVANLLMKDKNNSMTTATMNNDTELCTKNLADVNQMQFDSHSLFFNLGEQIVKSSVVCAGEKGLCKQPPVERCEGLEVCNPTLYNTNYVSGEEEKDNRLSGDRSALASPAPGASDLAGMARAYQEATMMQMKSSDTEAPTPTEATLPENQSAKKKDGKWVRNANKGKVEGQSKMMQPIEHDQTNLYNQNAKRFRPPTLSECLGEEGVKRLREMELNRLGEDIHTSTQSEERNTTVEGGHEGEGKLEATGPGAPGQLTGANDSACQAP